MKIKKRHITTALATLLLASPMYFTTENKTEATNSFKEISTYAFAKHSLNFKNWNSPLEIPEITIIGKKIHKLDELDSHEPYYLDKKELNKKIDSLYFKIKPPKEIPSKLFIKLIQKESSFNIYAHHPKSHARGLAQIREPTWKNLEKEISYSQGVYNPEKNLEVSLKTLKWIERYNKRFNPNWKDLDLKQKQSFILASYNWGIGNIKRNSWDLEKAPTETQEYISYILKE